MTEILINSYDRNSGNYQDFIVQLNTLISITKPTKLRLKYFRMVNGIYNISGSNMFVIQEQIFDNSTQSTTNKQFDVAVSKGSYTPSDFANAAQTTITNASATNGNSWTYTVSYDSTMTQMTYNMTTSAPSGYIYTAYINVLTNEQVYLTGISIYLPNINVNILPITVTPNLSNYNLLLTVNKNTHNHITTNVKKHTFIIPFSTSDTTITYNNNTNFVNIINVFPQSFNNISIGMTCLEFNPSINNECVILMELED